jgi:hypothetical protein
VLERLEAEDTLAKSKAKLSAVVDKAKARLEVAKKLRDVRYRKFEGGQGDLEEFLVWQKRCVDLENDVILMTGGDKVRRFADQVAELKRIEKRVGDQFDQGQVQESDVQIVRYYLLEAEEALANAKDEAGENPRKAMTKE